MKNILLITLLMFFTFETFSQDVILNKSGDKLEVKVTEVGDDFIKYKKIGFENGPDFKMAVSGIFMLTFENGEQMMFNKSIKKNNALLRGGTQVQLRMNETISSDQKGGKKVSVGEVITLTVHQDVSDIDGNVLIKQGTQVNGTITMSVKRKMAGTKGKLSFSVNGISAVDNQTVPVNFRYEFGGEDKGVLAIAGAAILAAPLILIKGKPAVIQEGTVFRVLVSTDKKINLDK